MTIHKLKNITYDLVKMEKALIFQVLEQDDIWNEFFTRGTERYKCKNAVIIVSEYYPEIKYYCTKETKFYEICLRGIDTKYNLLPSSTNNFETNQERDKYYTKINQALEEWNEMVEQLKQEKKQ